jgi:transcriptional regulator with XRE-family HTH domain
MGKQKHDRQLPPLSKHRVRRLRARIPLEVLAVEAGIPSASLSRFERGEHQLLPDQLARLEDVLKNVAR